MRIGILSKKIALSLQALALMFGFGAGTLAAVTLTAAPAYAGATCTGDPNTDGLAGGIECSKGDSQRDDLFGDGGVFETAANTLIFLVGAISVLFLIIGGLRYVISNGDSKNVTAAKDTILYAIIGVVVAIISFALVQFVVGAIGTGS